jgi:hypothetical protein
VAIACAKLEDRGILNKQKGDQRQTVDHEKREGDKKEKTKNWKEK